MTKMAGIPPKTYSIWNDMDSTWIPCGIHGESKDLNLCIIEGIVMAVNICFMAYFMEIKYMLHDWIIEYTQHFVKSS